MTQASIIDWRGETTVATSTKEEWIPHPLGSDQWPPNYEAVWNWRSTELDAFKRDPSLIKACKKYYSTRPSEFIMHWMDTYDPRNSPKHPDPARRAPKWMPFVFFKKQGDLVDFFQHLDHEQESGLIEKSRDMGATWVACGYSIWCFLFLDDDSTGWGSRKEQLVDKLGDADSIFEKLRLLLKRLPKFFLPEGFTWSRHSSFMKLINPENGSTITGEAGDNIGRGGRKSRYFKDEAAHYERPEKIEAALGDNTNVQIDISSVNGLGNVFHRRREQGQIWYTGAKVDRGYVRVLIMDWSDHPKKDQEWYDARKAKYEREGLAHVFAQEVDRDYAAAVSNTVIPYEWIKSAVDAHIKVDYIANDYQHHKDRWIMGLDVADDGDDRNSLTLREWIIWRYVEEWGDRDPGVTARKAVIVARQYRGKINVQYDSIGVGAAVKAEYNRLIEDDEVDLDVNDVPFVPWNAGAGVVNPYQHIIEDDPESQLNRDFFGNLKAQAWWDLRSRFYKTHKAVTEGAVYPTDELISLDSDMPLLEDLMKELAQPTRGQSGNLKMIIDKKPPGTKSPNKADGGVMAFFPLPFNYGELTVGSYGN